MYFHILGSSINEIHLCPGTGTAEAFVAPFHLHSWKYIWREDFGTVTPFSGIMQKLWLMALVGGPKRNFLFLSSLAKWNDCERIFTSSRNVVSSASSLQCSLSFTGKCLLLSLSAGSAGCECRAKGSVKQGPENPHIIPTLLKPCSTHMKSYL